MKKHVYLFLTAVTALEILPFTENTYQKSKLQDTFVPFEVKIEKTSSGWLGLSLALGKTRIIASCPDTSNLQVSIGNDLTETRDLHEKKINSKVWSTVTSFFKAKRSNKFVELETVVYDISPYEDKFISISGSQHWHLEIKRVHICFFKVACVIAAILIFRNAEHLAEQALVWYLGGVSLSMIFGVLLLAYIVFSRLMPKRESIFVLGFVGSVTAWLEWIFNGFIRTSILNLAKNNMTYLVIYCVSFGLIGFVYFYIKGAPTENPRAVRVLHVIFKATSFLLIYHSFYKLEIAMAVMTLMVFSGFFPFIKKPAVISPEINRPKARSQGKVNFTPSPFQEVQREKQIIVTPTVIIPRPEKGIKSLFSKSSTPKPFRRYMTEDEYLRQGYVTTEQELRKLRNYCQSPLSSPWKTAEQLKDPKRFASFVNGSPHVSEIELSNFEHDLDSMESLSQERGAEGDIDTREEATIEKIDPSKENYLSVTPAEIGSEKDSQAETPTFVERKSTAKPRRTLR